MLTFRRFRAGGVKEDSEVSVHDAVRTRRHATWAGLAAILLWSTAVALVRSLSEGLGPVTAGAAVYGVSGGLTLAGLLMNRGRWDQVRRLPRRYLLVCGGLFVGYVLALYLAIGMADSRQQVLEVGLLNYLWPCLTLLLTVALLNKAARLTLVPATMLALAGVFLVLTPAGDCSWRSFAANFAGNPVAYLLGLAAAGSWGLYSVLTRKLAGGHKTGAVELFLPATAVTLLLMCPFVHEPRVWTARACVEAVALGLMTVLSYGLWDKAMRGGNMVVVAAVSYLTPFFSTVVSCFYLAVAPEPRVWVGCGLLIAGSLMSWYSVRETDTGHAAGPAAGKDNTAS